MSDHSKFLSLVLRHRPEAAGVVLDREGWASVDALLAGCAAHGRPITREELEHLVATSDKQRLAFSADGQRIRANQGHSVDVELGLRPIEPPPVLFHGTVARFLPSIRGDGLLRGARTHVHLSADVETAERVAARRGAPVIVRVDAAAMARDGFPFFCSANGVWLTEAVPPRYLTIP